MAPCILNLGIIWGRFTRGTSTTGGWVSQRDSLLIKVKKRKDSLARNRTLVVYPVASHVTD